MIIPSEVKVAGVIYKVVEKDFVIVDESAGLGSCDFDKTEIELKTGMSQTRKEQVFIHELTHAILFEAGYTEHDEDLVDRFSIVAHQVLKDNRLVSEDKELSHVAGKHLFKSMFTSN